MDKTEFNFTITCNKNLQEYILRPNILRYYNIENKVLTQISKEKLP